MPEERSTASMAAPSKSPKEWTVLALLRWTTGFFQERGIDSARLDAECLLAYALGCDRVSLYVDFEKPVTLIVGHNGAGKTTIIE